MSAISAGQARQTPARPASGQALPGEISLADGTPALIWPLLPTDAETLRALFDRLSPESRQHRFLYSLAHLDDLMIERLVGSVDGVQHIALVLTVLPAEGEEGPAGVARLLQYPDDPATADIAVTVVDEWQGRGIGTALVAALMRQRPAAVTRLHTVVAADNRASLALLAQAGPVTAGRPERGVLDVTVELPAAPQPRSPVQKVADFWAQGALKFIDRTYLLLDLPQANRIPAAERYVEFVQRMVRMNHELTRNWLAAAGRLPGAARQIPAEPPGDAVPDTAAQPARR
jgi:RimJ/RimL family protein N-acetyltransferase